MRALNSRTTNHALAYLQEYKIQKPFEIEFKHLKVPLIGKAVGRTKLEDIKPQDILDNINLDHPEISEWKEAGQWFSLKDYKGAKKKADKPSDNMLALLLDPDEAKKVGTAGYDMSKSWALIGGSGKGVATMNKAKLNEVLHDIDPTYNFDTKTLAQFLRDLKTKFPDEIADGTILHLGMTSTIAGKESVVQIIHDASGNIVPIMIVNNEKSSTSAVLPSGYIVTRYNNVSKLFELTSEPDPYKARVKIEYRFYKGLPTPSSPPRDEIWIDVSSWGSTQFANCMNSWMKIGTGMATWHEGNRTRQLEEVNGSTVYVRNGSVSPGSLNNSTNYVSVRELGGIV